MSAAAPHAPGDVTPPQPVRLLVVDDDPDVIELTELVYHGATLAGRPVECAFARSAEEAVALLEGACFDLGIIDVVMRTDHEGLELVRWIRAQPRHRGMAIVLRTGQVGIAPAEFAFAEAEIDAYWSKTELTAAIMHRGAERLLLDRPGRT
jgi:CheY-like chemotaxis protein